MGVVGCGLMGSGIAEVAARAGYPVTVREVNGELLARGQGLVQKSLATALQRGKLSAEACDAAWAKLTFTTDLAGLAQCDLVIEAATENPSIKKELFAALDAACHPATILASNTSSIPIVELAAATKRPALVLGLHFFNPAPVMQLVEVIRTIVVAEATVDVVRHFAEGLGKTAILAKDRAGFIVNVLLVPYLLDAVRLVEQGVATKEDIDLGMRLGCGYPMGPLQLLDFVGIDTTYYIAEIMFQEFKEAKFAPPPLLKQMTIAGLHGRKTGQGFYTYH
ncbi:MAG: 3-hydroxybutyryl-CoA dehydrogenase [Chloroflexota bacterium]